MNELTTSWAAEINKFLASAEEEPERHFCCSVVTVSDFSRLYLPSHSLAQQLRRHTIDFALPLSVRHKKPRDEEVAANGPRTTEHTPKNVERHRMSQNKRSRAPIDSSFSTVAAQVQIVTVPARSLSVRLTNRAGKPGKLTTTTTNRQRDSKLT